jgi:hypothetical protein
MKDTKHYEQNCSGGSCVLGPPTLAVFDIDHMTAEFILKLAALCKEHGLHKVEKFDSRVSWREDESIARADDPDIVLNDENTYKAVIDGEETTLVEMRSECNYLNITQDAIWFTCYRKHQDNKISTHDINIAELTAAFGLQSS